MYVQANVKQL